MNIKSQIEISLRARITLLVLVTVEEERMLALIREICEADGRSALSWDVADGFQVMTSGSVEVPAARDPLTALEQIDRATSQSVFVLKDFHDCWDNAQVRRKLRTVAQKLRYTSKSIIVISPHKEIPLELENNSVSLEIPLPDPKELEAVLDDLTRNSAIKMQLTPLGREKLIRAAVGLTVAQAQRVFAKAVVIDGRLDDRDIELVSKEKQQIIRNNPALEYYSVTESPENVGGLDVLKSWLQLRERAFGSDARNYGLPVPRGIALIGIPGTGKSLTAKMIGGLWRIPLLRLDIGALFGSLVGESEARARQALRLAEAVAPCVLWIDEIEKGLAQGGLDSGTSSRVFATLLTWMQEKTAPCFVVATANNIASIPPELLRKGRFDEVFFLDLPTQEERQAIFSVHLKKRNRLVQDYQIDRLAKAAEGYVGAEIEQAIIDAMYIGFNEQREITTQDILRAIKKQVPLSVSQKEIVNALRNWLQEGRAQSASFAEVKEAAKKFVPLQLHSSKTDKKR